MPDHLVDTNLLLRSSDPGSPTYLLAIDAITRLIAGGGAVFITAQNLVEFWAVATRPLDANGLGWSIEQARIEIERLLDQFSLLEETPAVFAHWLQLVTSSRVSGRQVHDARLVAVMQAHSVTHLLTFNTEDFRRYPGI